MPSLKLTYFNAGGRAESIRLALAIGGVPFEDERFPNRDAFVALKPSLPYGQVPVLSVDGEVIGQSMGILRYVGKLSGLYPEDALAAAKVDEFMDANTDAFNLLIPTFSEKDEEKKKATREALVAGPLSAAYDKINKRVEALGTGGHCVGSSLTIADLVLYGSVFNIQGGQIDYISKDFMAQFPALMAVYNTVAGDSRVVAYYAAAKKA